MSGSVKPVTRQYIGEYENIAAQDGCLGTAGGGQKLALGDLTEWSSGGTPPKSNPEFWGGDIPWISASSMKTGRLSESDRTLTPEGLKRGSRLARKGDVLLLVRGSELHKRIPVGIAVRDVSFNQDVKALRAKNGLDKDFLYCWLAGNETMLLSKVENTGIGAGKLDTNILKNLSILLPPLPEQRRIAHILGTLDDKIENNRKTAKTLEAMAQAIFKSWFVDFDPVRAKMAGESRESICKRLKLTPEILDLFPDRLVDSELGEIPEGWRVDSIYQIADVIYGAPFNSSEFNARQVGEPLIRIRDLTTEVPGVWTTETHPKGYKVKRGDIVVGMDGEFRAHLWGGAEAWLNQRVCIFAPKKSFSSLFVRNSIVNLLAHVEATETATTVIHIGKNDIDLFFVMIPENNLLHTFNKFYQPFYDAIVRSKWETHKLGDTRDTLLPKLISGEIRVSDVASIIGGSIREPHIDGSSKVTA
ncbi:hypothetical protein A6O26_02715 [Acidithiobacillus thiooxidans]|uniref:restriction endonuclease subunit S n=1 Tax=Acidithiobacillus thiooxidans TaxID=930 RepID=UPI0008242FF3|nr:restriction endonuclease subunit S [Acidithiobacillus thiooxidans]OCX84976.1 hypothetical protein A6O26_02715 [Acidithiobacillus thiooxidans]